MGSPEARLVLGIPSADHSLYARLALDRLHELAVSTHVILPQNPTETFANCPHLSLEVIEKLSADTHAFGNIGAPMASGSWSSYGMLLLPGDAAILRRIALGLSGSLLTRTADVMLKERRKLIVVPFEEEWDEEIIDHLTTITEAGGMVLPPFPSFYLDIDRIEPMVRRTVDRALMKFDYPVEIEEWRGIER